jgi:hypothetical protein
MFFNKFDKVTYGGKEATNIINSILVKYHPATNTTQFLYHTVKDGETPEVLAHKYYGNPYFHWIIILMNNIVDPNYDWPLDPQKFNAMMTNRYGSGNEDKVHHFTDQNGKRLDEVAALDAQEYFDINGNYPVNVLPVSNREYEIEKNDEKREIKILRSRYLNEFVNQFEDLMSRETA